MSILGLLIKKTSNRDYFELMMAMARFLMIMGVVFLIAGGLVYLFSRLGLTIGRLPGDIRLQGENATCVLALGTSILLSILLTIVLNVIVRLMNR